MDSSLLRGHGGHHCVVTHHVLDDLIEYFRLHRLLDKVARTLLQGGHDVFLVADGGHHDHPRIGMAANDALGGLNAFHLRHGDVHEHDVGSGAFVFGDGG